MNSVQQQTCSSVFSDINNQPLHQPTISQKGATHFVQPTSNATSSCTNVNVLPVAVAEQDGMVTSRCKSATHPSNGALFQANHNQVLAANHNQIVGANPNQVFAHFHPPMANQFSIQQHPALASQHNGGGTILHFTSDVHFLKIALLHVKLLNELFNENECFNMTRLFCRKA